MTTCVARADRRYLYDPSIGFFGSAARGQLTPESDVDVVVELAEPDLLALIGIEQEVIYV